MEYSPTKGGGPIGLGARLIEAAGVVVSLPFAVGAVTLGWRLSHLPETAGQLARAQILGAFLFAFGLAMGIVGSSFAVTSRTPSRRALCTALTLFGLSHVIFGVYIRHAIEATIIYSTPPVLPLLIPLALWAYSVVLALRAPRLGVAKRAPLEGAQTSAEQPQPLSRS